MSDEKPLGVKVSRIFLKRFLQMYKNLPCLWDRHNPEYKNKKSRNEAIGRLTKFFNIHDPKATRVHVLRKIESMRSSVRREHRRVQVSVRNSEVHTPNLWYYHLLSFVFDDRDGKTFESETESVGESTEMITADGYDEPAIIYPAYVGNVLEEARAPTPQSTVDSKRYTDVIDEYSAIGINVAAKLRALPVSTKILAEKLINDVLYQAQIDCLTSDTVLTTPDPIKEDIL